MSVEVRIPSVGESISEVTIAEWVKKNGDPVSKGDVLLVLETDKASVEINAEDSGQLSTSASEGDTVEVGAVVGAIDTNASAPPSSNGSTDNGSTSSNTAPSGGSAKVTGDPIDIVIPGVGESITEVTISEWSVSDGAYVNRDDVLMVLETDKASVDVNAEQSGIIKINTQAGETVPVGQTVGTLTPAEGGSPGASKKEIETASLEPPAATSAPAAGSSTSARVTREETLQQLIQPQAKKTDTSVASSSTASGKEPMVQSSVMPGEEVEEVVPMTPIRKTIARRLKEVQNTAAILTTFNEIDLTNAMAMRKQYQEDFVKKYDVKLGLMSIFIKACIEGLRDFPAVNGRIEGDSIVFNHFYNIGVAVSTPKGLMVPVLKGVDRMSLAEIELAIKGFAAKARDGKIGMDDLSGGTFSVTNGGTFGSMMSTPILNPPQSGILGMHAMMDRPMAVNGQVEIRKMMYVALSYDHRIIDGKEAVSFLVKVKQCVEDPQRLLINV